MVGINKKDAELFGLDDEWNIAEFDLQNPTSSDIVTDLFNVNNLFNVPVSPNPIVNPTVVSSVIPVGTNPVGVAYNPIDNTIYVCNFGSNDISIIDCDTNAVIGSPIPVGSFPREIAYNPVSNTMYVTNQGSSDVYVIDCYTNTVLGSPIVVGSNSIGISYNSLNNCMYVCSSTSNDVYVIDCNTNAVVSIISTGSFNTFISYNNSNNTMYVTIQSLNIVIVIDCDSNTIVGSPINVGTTPEQISYNPNNNSMYLVNLNSNNVSVIDCDSNTVSNTISVGTNPYAIQFNSLTNSMYVSCVGSNDVFIIDCSTNTTSGSPISVGTNPRGIAYNFNSNSMYISNVLSNDVYSILPSVPQVFYINGSTNYNEFVRDIFNNPAWVRRIVLYTENKINLNQYINHIIRDANGNLVSLPDRVYVGVNQFQGTIGKIDYPSNSLILGMNEYLSNFTIRANSGVKLLLIYQQIEKTKLLSSKGSICDNIEWKKNPVQAVRIKQNDENPFDYVPMVNPYEIKKREVSIKPFDFKIFSKLL